MKNIKTRRQDPLESSKPVLFQVGLIITLSLVFFAFEWKVAERGYHGWDVNLDRYLDEDMVAITRHEKPEPPVPKQKPFIHLIINEIDNSLEDSFDPADFNIEIEPDQPSPEFFIPVVPEENIDNEDDIFKVVEEDPSFPGGLNALYTYLNNNIYYTDLARSLGITGTVYISFVVEKNGSISNIEVRRSLGAGLDEVAIKAVQNMPRWNPGKQRTKPVRVEFILPVKFQLR